MVAIPVRTAGTHLDAERIIVIALGCNVGPRRETLMLACHGLESVGIRVMARSRQYWTKPWGYRAQPDFLNAAVRVATHLRPMQVLDRIHEVESRIGRRRLIHWGPRRIDLDLLLYGKIWLKSRRLTLPHARIAERDFVLAPLIDLHVPPLHAIAPQGWQALLDKIPPNQRSIIHSQPW